MFSKPGECQLAYFNHLVGVHADCLDCHFQRFSKRPKPANGHPHLHQCKLVSEVFVGQAYSSTHEVCVVREAWSLQYQVQLNDHGLQIHMFIFAVLSHTFCYLNDQYSSVTNTAKKAHISRPAQCGYNYTLHMLLC